MQQVGFSILFTLLTGSRIIQITGFIPAIYYKLDSLNHSSYLRLLVIAIHNKSGLNYTLVDT
jgi:hypothetical protein